MQSLVDYVVAREGQALPEVSSQLYEYVLAGNGMFVRGRREGLEAMVPVSFFKVRGLQELDPYCVLKYPKCPTSGLEIMLRVARDACTDKPTEVLFYMQWDGYQWQLHVPPQDGSEGHVKTLDDGADSKFASSLVDIHSHHVVDAFFSPTDNKEEQGFRLYGVLGNIFEGPTIRLRVGIYGHFMEVPATTLFEGYCAEVGDAYREEYELAGDAI
jgi:PRTRC genetic system protein A